MAEPVLRPEDTTLADGARWYVVQTLVHREAGARAQLAAQGYHTFLPRMVRTVRHARRLRSVLRAVFPGYLFVALDLRHDRWRSINGTVGVSRLITANDLPAPVPAGVVEAVAAALDERGLCRFDHGLRPGQSVRIVSGPFADFIGRLASLDDRGRARVLLEVMGSAVTTSLACGALAPA